MAKKKNITEWIESALIAGFIILLAQLFVAEVYIVPSSSMESTIKTEEAVLLSKLHYGARIPITPISIPFTNKYVESIELPYYRLPGFSEIKRGDLVAFNYPVHQYKPIDRRKPYLKRCMGLPGDTIKIVDKTVFINKKIFTSPSTLQYEFALEPDSAFSKKKLAALGITEIIEKEDEKWYVNTTQELADSLLKLRLVKEVRGLRDKPKQLYEDIFPVNDEYKWSRDDFGPLPIPKKGDTLEITKKTFPLWSHILTLEGNNVVEMHGYVKIDGEKAEKYAVKQNYYFMLGDNRHNSSDSRNWGLVPESHIIGKVVW